MANSTRVVSLVKKRLKELACPSKAKEMARYMKTEMPFYGVQKPNRIPILKEIKKNYAPSTLAEYEDTVWAMWKLKHREEKYLSINYATEFISLAEMSSIPLFEKIIRDGSWWDFIDPIASQIIGHLLLEDRSKVTRILDKWICDDDFWIRRTALLSHLKHKDNTDQKTLFKYVSLTMHEKEFFIRKAIGWALREYSYTEPAAVKKFLLDNKQELSPLSFKEGAKRLVKTGKINSKELK